MKKISIGQIGIGHNHAAEKMKAVRKFPNLFEVAGVCEPDECTRASRGGDEAYRGLPFVREEELLSRCDAMLVETDVWNLVPAAQRCIDAGVHIHLDKPAGENLRAYERLLHDAEAKCLAVQLGYMYRYNPAVLRCRELVRNGTLGEIISIDAMMSTDHSAEYRAWLEHFAGGSLYIFGCHLIDLIILMMGTPRNIVSFQKSTGIGGVHAADNGFAVLEYEKGVSTVRTSSVEINGFGRRQLVVCGTGGTVEIKPLERPTTMTQSIKNGAGDYSAYRDQREPVQVRDAEVSGRYDDMIVDFAHFIAGTRSNPFSYAHELTVHSAVLAACGISE